VSIKLLLDSALAQGAGEAAADARSAPVLAKARTRLEEALAEVRQLSHQLRPALLDTLGLPSALRQIGEEFADHAELAFFMRSHGRETELPEEIKTVLFRVTQEALANIGKHARATRVDLRLIFHRQAVRLTVQDDGAGFDAVALQNDPKRGIGLRNMQERLASVGGQFRVDSRPGSTRVIAQVPAEAIARFALARPARGSAAGAPPA
jgi:two-component system NarL family sensor kinase